MATDFYHFSYLVQRDFELRGESFEAAHVQLAEIERDNGMPSAEDSDFDLDDYYKRCEVVDPATLGSVTNGSRRGWLVYALQQLSEAATAELKVLYGAEEFSYPWQAPESYEENNGRLVEWARWKAVTLRDEELRRLSQEITRVFDWLGQHVRDLGMAMYGDFCSEEELVANVNNPVLSRDTALDRRIWYAEDGDGPHCLFSFLHSIRQLCENAYAKRAGVLLIVQVPR